MDKKAQIGIGNLQAIVLALVVIGILIGIGFLVFQEFQTSMPERLKTTQGETITPTSAGVYVVNNHTSITCWKNGFAVTDAYNATSEYISPGNYTIEATTGKVTNTTVEHADQDWVINYTYYDGGDACVGVQDTITATKKIPTWLAIVVILLIVGILLAIVFKTLPSGEAGFARGSTSYSSGTTAEI